MQACFLSQPALAEWKEHSISAVSNGLSAASSAYPATTRPKIERDFPGGPPAIALRQQRERHVAVCALKVS
jgi:hypothetical protein